MKSILYSLFVVLFTISCGSISEEDVTTDTPDREVKHIKSYRIGGGLYESSEALLFKYKNLDELIDKEINYHMGSRGFERISQNPQTSVYYFFLAKGQNTAPVLPYAYTSEVESTGLNIPVDSLRTNEYFLVLDIVDAPTNQLIWRGYDRLKADKRESLFRSIPISVEQIINSFPG